MPLLCLPEVWSHVGVQVRDMTTDELISHVSSAKNKADMANAYAEGLVNDEQIDWDAVSQAILGRWSPSGLKDIKRQSWTNYRYVGHVMNAAVERIREQIAYHETFSTSDYIEVPFESLHILLDAYDREHETANELRNLVAHVAQIVLPAGDEAGA